MSAYIHAIAPISRRSLALFCIVGLHAVFIFALTNGLMPRVIRDQVDPLVVDFPQVEQRPLEAPPSVEPVLLEKFQIPVPTPPAPIEFASETPTVSAADETLGSTYSGTATQDVGDSLVHAGLGKNFPNPDSFYPPSAIRQEIEGKALVHVCVGPDGKLTEAPQIAQSTQNASLDEAALRLARAGRYVAGSRGGVAVTDCFDFQTTFQIKNRG